jgi:Tol biopolymer transport system component
MKRIGRLWHAMPILGVVVGATPVGAQARGADATVILQAASHQESVVGNLDSAITLYRRVAEDRRADRGSVARALVSLGRTYELRGQTDAVRAYQRVVNDYGDQSEQATVARQRLAALQGGNAARVTDRMDRVFSMIYDDLPALRDHDAPHYDYSPSGDRMVVRVPNDLREPTQGASLVLMNSGGVALRTLVPSRREVGLRFPRWSPDGKWIAYGEAAWVGADTSFRATKIIPAEGGTPRTISTTLAPWSGAQGGFFWTPDSKGLTLVGPRQITTFDLDGRVVKTVPYATHNLTQVTGYSPDGRWLALHRLIGAQQDQMDVYLMPAEGGSEIKITRTASWNAWPAWAPDGRSLYFMSNRGGRQNIWQVGIDPRTGAALGDPLPLTSYTDVKLKHPKVIGGSRLAFALIRETGTIRLASPARPDAARALARGTEPQVSPDGRTIYYLSQGTTPPGIFAIATDSAPSARRITSHQVENATMSRDGRSIAYFSTEGAQRVLRIVEVTSGTTRELTRFSSREAIKPAWSPDGSRVAYTRDSGLYVIPSAGGQPQQISQTSRWEGWTLKWSADGQYLSALVYLTEADSTNTAVLIPATGGAPRRITPAEETGYKEHLDWHPDGKRLTYMYYGHKDADDETRIAYPDGRPTVKLLNQPYPIWDYWGRWHPDGRDFYFIASANGSWSLYAHNEASNATRLVFQHGGAFPGVSVPTFSRDGSVMAFSTGTTTRQLWVIDGVLSR